MGHYFLDTQYVLYILKKPSDITENSISVNLFFFIQKLFNFLYIKGCAKELPIQIPFLKNVGSGFPKGWIPLSEELDQVFLRVGSHFPKGWIPFS